MALATPAGNPMLDLYQCRTPDMRDRRLDRRVGGLGIGRASRALSRGREASSSLGAAEIPAVVVLPEMVSGCREPLAPERGHRHDESAQRYIAERSA